MTQHQTPFTPTSGGYGNGNSHNQGFPPHSAGGGVVPPPNQNRQTGSFASPYAIGRRQEELLPPPSSSSGGLGALARSASLGARKKDPYSYSSDDVESGLGQMDMRGGDYGMQGQAQGYGQMSRPGYSNNAGGGGGGQSYGAVGSGMDVSMSSGGGTRPYSATNRAGMAPPPVPNQYARPPTQPIRQDSGGSSPARYSANPNPYVPRSSDPGPSIQIDEQPEWEYPRSDSNQRMPSSGSYHSQPSSDLRSPFLTSSDAIPSPHSPLLNPYDSSPRYSAQGMSSSPAPGTANGQWAVGYPPSPTNSMRPPQPSRSQSQQTYPSSQPVTPAGKYELGPPRGARDPRAKQPSRQGFRDVKGWNDLKPIGSEKANGRRADPLRPGKFLSVSHDCLCGAWTQLTSVASAMPYVGAPTNVSAVQLAIPVRKQRQPSKGAHQAEQERA
jgi:dual specificity protein kinase YAK1